jgi:penicillin-binding protein 2
MLATPLQLANVMCIIANKGYYYIPHFVDSIENETIEDTTFMAKYRRKHSVTHISNEDFEAVQLAMLDVTREGTAVGAQIEGIDICAKTGTAQNPHGKNHSLFVAFAPKEDPRIAIAVVIENAGYGATWAAPIASLLMEKYLNDTISAKRQPDVERLANADLIPAEIKHWYVRQDSIKLAKLAKQIDADKAPTFENTTDNRKITFDPEVEPNRKEPDSTDTSAKQKSPPLKPQEKQKKPIR